MCEKCVEIDKKISHYKWLAGQMGDKRTLQGIDELIRHGRNGWLIDPDNLQELIAGLSDLLQNLELRRQLGVGARRTILQSFTSAHQATQLAGLYRECVA